MAVKEALKLELKRNEALGADCFLMTFALDREKASACRPGQFYNLRPLDSTAPLLRRPISICDARPEESEMDLLVLVVGEGTRLLTAQLPGARIDAVGPLGKAFEADPSRPSLMIAGGVGVAPLYFLARSLGRKAVESSADPAPITFCYGARTAEQFVLLDRIESTVSQLVLTTEDGSRGEKGFVTVAAERLLSPDVQVFVCGPSPMMDALLKTLHARGLRGQFSLENQMGCGIGACQGCVVPSRRGMIRVCCDGPVVWSDELDSVMTD